MPFAFNHTLAIVPLIGGIAIANPNNGAGETGTLGCIATTDGIDRWIIGCYHVLCRRNGRLPNGSAEPIICNLDAAQPVIAAVTDERASPDLDVAAARISGWPAVGQIHGIGYLPIPASPTVGTRVIKSGAATGVTEGVVHSIKENVVYIRPAFSNPSYGMCRQGDSGAIWIDAYTHRPVAVHCGDRNNGVTEAFGPFMSDVLARLRLTLAQ